MGASLQGLVSPKDSPGHGPTQSVCCATVRVVPASRVSTVLLCTTSLRTACAVTINHMLVGCGACAPWVLVSECQVRSRGLLSIESGLGAHGRWAETAPLGFARPGQAAGTGCGLRVPRPLLVSTRCNTTLKMKLLHFETWSQRFSFRLFFHSQPPFCLF